MVQAKFKRAVIINFIHKNNFVMVYIILISILICGAILFSWYTFEKPFPLWLNTMLRTLSILQVGFICFSPFYLCSALKCTVLLAVTQMKMKAKSRHLWSANLFTSSPTTLCSTSKDCSFLSGELHISRAVWRPSVTVFKSQIIGWTGFWLNHFKEGQIWHNLKIFMFNSIISNIKPTIMMLCVPSHSSALQGSCHLFFSLSPFYHSQKITHVNITNIQIIQEETWSWRSRFLLFFMPCDRRRRQVGRHHSSQIFYVLKMHHVSVALSDALRTVAVREKNGFELGEPWESLTIYDMA